MKSQDKLENSNAEVKQSSEQLEARVQERTLALTKALQASLVASNAKSEFLSTMSHEIRTPMNAILGMSELLAETEISPDQRHYLEIMVANGNPLLQLINNILDLARVESGRLQIEKTEFDLGDLIDQTISTFGVSAHGKGSSLPRASRMEYLTN